MNLLKILDRIADDLLELMRKKTNKSGKHLLQLGLKGSFAGGIDRKYWRLRHMIWEHDEYWTNSELKDIEEEAIDMAGYAFLIIAQVRKKLKEYGEK